MVGPIPGPHPLQALPPLPGARATSLPPFPLGLGYTFGCSHFSPPSTAHDTQPTETTLMAALEEEVKF